MTHDTVKNMCLTELILFLIITGISNQSMLLQIWITETIKFRFNFRIPICCALLIYRAPLESQKVYRTKLAKILQEETCFSKTQLFTRKFYDIMIINYSFFHRVQPGFLLAVNDIVSMKSVL